MRHRIAGAALAAAWAFLCASPALADNYQAKEGITGAVLQMASKLFSGVHHPKHVAEGLDGSGVPTPLLMDGAQNLKVNCATGCGGGDASAANQTNVQANPGSSASKAVGIQGVSSGLPVPISASALPLPTGAATAAKQPALGAAGAPSADVQTMQGCAGCKPIPNQITARPSATFTFNGSTPTYAAGQIVANSSTAGSVTPLSWTATTAAACSFDLYQVKLSITQTGAGVNTAFDGWQLLMRFYTSAPAYGAGDGSAYRVTTGGANLVATYSCTLTQLDDAATGNCVPVNAPPLTLKLASGSTLYADLTAQGAPIGGARQASKVVTAELYEKMDIC